MQLGAAIKKAREVKGLSQKEVALACKMDQAQYSRIENGKTDPSFSAVMRIAKALGVELADLFRADEVFKDVSTIDKSLMERVALIDSLDKKEKAAFFTVLDALITKKKLKDNLSQLIAQ
ncbi:MAG: helix-turn-helix transcriptional regulator [Bacteroidota bacterium]